MQRRGFYASPPHLMSKGIATGRWLLLFHQIPPKRSEEHTSELQSQSNLVCRLLLEKKKKPAVRQCRKPGHLSVSRHPPTHALPRRHNRRRRGRGSITGSGIARCGLYAPGQNDTCG